MTTRLLAPALAATLLALPAAAQERAATSTPDLVVAISVDQLSSDLFEQYRAHYTGGLARLAGGAMFPNGYQSHAATETCPGHSTILTGTHPARNGVIANEWKVRRPDGALENVYCAEDEANRPPSGGGYTPSAVHLLVPTLGERMKAAWPGSKNVAISGKDRSALMMAGRTPDAIYWRQGAGFATHADRTPDPEAAEVNTALGKLLAEGAPSFAVPAWCTARAMPIALPGHSVGAGRFTLEPGDGAGLLRSPRFDQATLDLATRLVVSEGLGADSIPDVLSVSLAATDYVGHAYGTNGLEQCIQIAALDRMLGEFLANLDARGIEYIAILTADHGGIDLPERAQLQGVPQAHRVSRALAPAALADALGIRSGGLIGQTLGGDLWFSAEVTKAEKARALAGLEAFAARTPDLAAAFSAEELAAAPLPTGDPRAWSLLDRARASFYPGRSGDIVMLLEPGVSPIAEASPGIVSTHGSPWDYDRRVPILFWREGMKPIEQPFAVQAVDIAPTLAAILGLPVEAGAFDGRCLDLDAGEGDTCK